jgi:hypothetical protein
MKNKAIKFSLFVVGVVIVVGGIGFISNKQAPSPYTEFAQCLRESGTKFFGAFWCPHCQAQKAMFGSAKSMLPYVECSNTDRSQTPVCIDAKIESYPTWTFAKGINLTEDSQPIVCSANPGKDGEDPLCRKPGRASDYFTTWIFKDVVIKSPVVPVVNGKNWAFPKEAQTATGEIPLEFLSAQSGCPLPQIAK